jgi:hypothetical protein
MPDTPLQNAKHPPSKETPVDTSDRLDAVCARLNGRLKEHRAAIERSATAIKSIEEDLAILEHARAIVAKNLAAGETAAIKAAAPRREASSEKGLQEVVLQCVNEADDHRGLTAANVLAMVKSVGYRSPGVSSKSLYSSVYVSLLRLARKGDIRDAKGPKGRIFLKLDRTKPLFSTTQERPEKVRPRDAQTSSASIRGVAA